MQGDHQPLPPVHQSRDLFRKPHRHQCRGVQLPTPSSYVTVSALPGAPVAAFTGSPTTGTAPLDVTFTDNSTGSSITNRQWNFGDGNVSNYAAATNPVHRYTGAGTYSVNLTVTNAGGSNSQLRSSYITVSAPPGAPWHCIHRFTTHRYNSS